MKNKYIYLSLLAAGLISCEPEFEKAVDADYTAGEANFSSYVAIGNSLTAGYMDGTVYKSGQMNSYPNLLAQKFALVGGGAFTQPSFEEDVNDLGGFAGIPGSTRLVLDASQGRPEPINGSSTITFTPQMTAYNNMGVPGAKSFHLLAPGYGNPLGLLTSPPSANPYYVRHATSASATVLGDAMTKNPTFFTCWIGANDVLSFATSGGIGVDQTGNPNPATYGSNDITDPTAFAGVYTQIINTLTTGNAKGVVATIPSVTSIPFFTTVPYDPLNAETLGADPENDPARTKENRIIVGTGIINLLNTQLYGPLKQALTAFGAGNRIELLSTTGGNPLLIKDETLTDLSAQLTAAFTPTLGAATAAFYGNVFGQARQANANDLVLLTTSGVIGTAPAGVPAPLDKYGVTYPLQDQHILTASEITMISNATTAYNAAITSIASSKNLALVDMNAIMSQLVNGLRVDSGQIYTANYFSGFASEDKVLFSLDGVHPNARGYAVITNEIIKKINSHYKSNIPLYYPSFFSGIHIVPTN